MKTSRWKLPALLLCLVGLVGIPRAAAAQFQLGGYVGREFDDADNWFLFGAEGRFELAGFPFTLQPRFQYHPFTGGHVIQLDGNLLYHLRLVNPGRFRPYAGAGISWQQESGGGFSDSQVGFNLLGGTDFLLPGAPVNLFATAQYTVADNWPNSYTLVVGALYTFGGTRHR